MYFLFVEHECVQNSPKLESPTSHLLLWVGFGVLALYGLITTITALWFRVSVNDFLP